MLAASWGHTTHFLAFQPRTLHHAASALATAVCAAERALLGWSRCVTSSFPFSRSHVVDLAEGHVSALKRIESSKEPYCDPINLGTGAGTSVLGMIKVTAATVL